MSHSCKTLLVSTSEIFPYIDTINPTRTAIRRVMNARNITTSGENRKAVKVARRTMGFMAAANRNETVCETGTPFAISRLATGMLPHSHTGKKNPKSAIHTWLRILFFGMNFTSASSDTNVLNRLDTITPNVMNGSASMIIEKKTFIESRNTVG